MLIARILYPIEVLGPGKRVGLWFCGCRHCCSGCSNPELWEFDDSKNISLSVLYDLLKALHRRKPVDGFTITGGEPFDQEDELKELVMLLKNLSTDIIVYTGYTIGELLAKPSPAAKVILDTIAVLIDGPYIDELNNGVFLRGSANQQTRILRDEYKSRYTEFLAKGTNQIQNFRINDREIVSVGIHKRNFKRDLSQSVEKYGLLEGVKPSLY